MIGCFDSYMQFNYFVHDFILYCVAFLAFFLVFAISFYLKSVEKLL